MAIVTDPAHRHPCRLTDATLRCSGPSDELTPAADLDMQARGVRCVWTLVSAAGSLRFRPDGADNGRRGNDSIGGTAMKWLFVVIAMCVLGLAAVGCGTATNDPLVGTWKTQDPSSDMSFKVDAPKNGVYQVTWTNPSQASTASAPPAVVTFTLKRQSPTVYVENDGQTSTFTLGTDNTVVSVEYTDVSTGAQRVNFVKTTN